MSKLHEEIYEALDREMARDVEKVIKADRLKKLEQFSPENYQIKSAITENGFDVANYDFINFWLGEIRVFSWIVITGKDLKDYNAETAWKAIEWYRAQVKESQ